MYSKTYYVYILTTKYNRVLYVGMTDDLERRILEHKNKAHNGFTARYSADKLVYFEESDDVGEIIAREKQIKGWLRKKKIDLIIEDNPEWQDLSAEWF